jgi:hypothetical protein
MNDFLKKVLPWLGAAATGGVPAIIGMAAKTVGDILGSEIGNTVEAITQAVAGATPEQMILLKEADHKFSLQMQQMGFAHESELEQIAADDRASARNREIALKDHTPAMLAAAVTLGFFGVLTYILGYGVPKVGGDALLVMLGSLGTAWSGIIAFYFGSSAGSSRKDITIANMKAGQ